MRYRLVTIIMITLVAISLVLPTVSHARGYGHGYRGWHGGWGWYGPGAFAGGLLLGTALSRPYYYAPPPPYVYAPPPVVYGAPPPPVYSAPPPVYYPNQAYTYPDPAFTSGPENKPSSSAPSSPGQWVEVPGQSVNGRWVPQHKVWVPDNP